MTANRQQMLMAKARGCGTFNANTLAQILHEGEPNLQEKRAAWRRVEIDIDTSDPNQVPIQYTLTSREDLYREGLVSGAAAWRDSITHGHTQFDMRTPRYALTNASPFGMHHAVFGRTISLMGSPEQKKRWLPVVKRGYINGAYLQTELAHGSHVAGIMTTATFDPGDDTITLHSPTIEAIKYWPGSIGFSATHGIVMARLLVPSNARTTSAVMPQDHGVHSFLVQLRNPETGVSTRGVELGDVGLKPAYNQNDNGYARFDQVKIPRTDMLMGHCSLNNDGKVTRLAPARAVYVAMISSRAIIVQNCGFQLAQAVVIAIRYAVVREQGRLPFDKSDTAAREIPILTYRTQQYRLLTLLAKAYAMFFTSRTCREVQNDMEVRLEGADHSTVARAHALMAGAKAWFTTTTAEGAEDARKCCGGHGYLCMSGLPEITASTAALCTLEGDNMVLWQQTARALLKTMQGLEDQQYDASTISPEMAYLVLHRDSMPATRMDPSSLNSLLRLASCRVYERVNAARRDFKQSVDKGMTMAAAWNHHMLQLVRAAQAHITLFVANSFSESLDKVVDRTVHRALERLCHLFVLTQLAPQLSNSDFGSLAFFTQSMGSDGTTVLETSGTTVVNSLLEHLVPDAVVLTDAWDFSDASLASALGCYDGNVYERLMMWTRQLPINKNADKMSGYNTKDSWAEYMQAALTVGGPNRARL